MARQDAWGPPGHGAEHTRSSAGLVRAGTPGAGAQLPLTRERSVSSSRWALPSPVGATRVYERNVDMLWTPDASRDPRVFEHTP